MKKLRVIFAVASFVLAVGFAITPQLIAKPFSAIDGYQFIPASGGDPAKCSVVHNVCDSNGTVACTITGGITLRINSTVSASCGSDLKKL